MTLPDVSAPCCNRCMVPMRPGIVLPTASVPMGDDFFAVGSWVECVPITACWKCPSCGHSFIPAAPRHASGKDKADPSSEKEASKQNG